VYLGFVIINIELLEIIIDGLFGTHRVAVLGSLYDVLILIRNIGGIGSAVVIIFWIRRNVIKLKRFNGDLKGFQE
jgi:hypothetical protein